VPYPDKLLADDEEVVASLHPHALAVFWPVVRLLLTVGGASFGAALVPAGPLQRPVRLAIAGIALLLVLVAVLGPLLRWRGTRYVVTTHRLLHRTGVLSRRGRDIPLARITDVSFSQTLWERVIRAGTVSVSSAGEGVTVLRRVPGSERVQQLLNHMVEEDADRRGGRGSAWVPAGWDTDPGDVEPGFLSGWGTSEHPTADFRTDPVA
jgi:uncharacterized membrane protein YdbT with pleckstrin-like domain